MWIGPRSSRFTNARIVQQRIDAGVGHVGVGRDVPSRIEQDVGTPSLQKAVQEEMFERINAGFCNVPIGADVVIGVEQAVSNQIVLCDFQLLRRDTCSISSRRVSRFLGAFDLLPPDFRLAEVRTRPLTKSDI